MNETKKMHDVQIEWGCITNLMNKISDIEDKIEGGWPELVDMIADAVTEEGEKKDPVSAFFDLYQFLWRLYYRLKTNPEKRPFNQYYKGEDGVYWIENYNYTALKWAIGQGFTQEIDNNAIKIRGDKLTDKQRQAMSRRCEQKEKRDDY